MCSGDLCGRDQLKHTCTDIEQVAHLQAVSTLHTLLVHDGAVGAVKVLHYDLMMKGGDLCVATRDHVLLNHDVKVCPSAHDEL
jgi:hypothetical protein